MEATRKRNVSSIIKSMQNGKIILFVGSAISIFPPTNLPSGKEVKTCIEKSLKDQDIHSKYTRKNYYRGYFWSDISFEGILELCDYKRKVYSFLRRLYRQGEPNDIHYFIAEAILKKKLFAVITTNYDEAIENAYKKITHCKKLKPIKEKNELKKIAFPFFIKVHGSITDSMEKIITTLSQESKGLPRKKAELLSKILANKEVLFVGYSGYDFNICPYLLKIPIKKIYWCVLNNLRKDVSYEAREVMKKFNSFTLRGDMRGFFEEISSYLNLPFSSPSNPKNNKGEIIRIFKEIFNDEERHVWFIKALNRIGIGKDALSQCNYILQERGISKKYRSRVIREKGQAYFHMGQYKSASKFFKEAAVTAKKNKEHPSFIASLLLDQAESHRCFGNISEYLMLIMEAYNYINKKINTIRIRSQFKGLLYLRISQLFEYLLTTFDIKDEQFVRKILFKNLNPLLRRAEKLFNEDDDFFGKSHLKYRIGKTEKDPLHFTELSKRYSRLGYAVGKVNANRELSKAEFKSNKIESALKSIKFSINIAKKIWDLPGLAKGYEILGNIEAKQGNNDKAKEMFLKSWKYYLKMEIDDILIQMYHHRTINQDKSL